ncbi:hypothetical protein J5N97_021545 [Dioscorea zingiberensis]|uniref:glutathione transferase n=1 Tax=Dioscorea zingiberensis TaxID=325984 RepID=A0A9D5CI16_9LILI|nr:hypothetical protein J5N97_021545 [Dioscorea zingiberensis]
MHELINTCIYRLSSLYLVSDDGKTLVICINCLTKIVLCHFKGWKVLEDPTHVYEYMKLLFNRESFMKTKPTKEHVIAGADLSDTLMDRMDPVVIIELKTSNGCTTKITA